jgi:antitoxin YobK
MHIVPSLVGHYTYWDRVGRKNFRKQHAKRIGNSVFRMPLTEAMSLNTTWLPLVSNLFVRYILEIHMTDLSKLGTAFLNARCPGGVSDSIILQAEEALGVRFPDSYRVFLSRYGALSKDGFEIAGLCEPSTTQSNNLLWLDVIVCTKQIRRSLHGQLPGQFVFVSDDGSDIKYFIDTSTFNACNESPVIALGPNTNSVIVASDFFEFALKLSKDELAF